MEASAAPTAWSPRWEITLGDCPTALAWNATDDALAVATLAGEVVHIDVASAASERVADHAGGALCVGWAGGRLISGGQDGTVTVDGRRIDVGGWVGAVNPAGDARRVAVAHGRQVSILDVGADPPTLLHHDLHDTTVTCLCWHPTSSDVLVAGSFGRIANDVVLTAAAVLEVGDVELPFGGSIAAVHASATGWWAAGMRGDVAVVWNDVRGIKPVELPTGRWGGHLLGFGAGGNLLSTASPHMTAVFDFDSTDPLGMPTGMWLTSIGTPTALAWRPRSAQLITAVSIGRGADDNGLLVWNPRRSPTPVGFLATTGPVEQLAWASSGELLALAFADGTVSVGAVDVPGWQRDHQASPPVSATPW
jgi:WD40 repeat protein